MTFLLAAALAVARVAAVADPGACVEIGAAGYDPLVSPYIGQQGSLKEFHAGLSMSLVSLKDGREAWFFPNDLRACPRVMSFQSEASDDGQVEWSRSIPVLLACASVLLFLGFRFHTDTCTFVGEPDLNVTKTEDLFIPNAIVVVNKPGSEKNGKTAYLIEYVEDEKMWAVCFLGDPETNQRMYERKYLAVKTVPSVCKDVMICVLTDFTTTVNPENITLKPGDLGVVRAVKDDLASIQFRKDQCHFEYWLTPCELCMVDVVPEQYHHLWEPGEIDAVIPRSNPMKSLGIDSEATAAGLRVREILGDLNENHDPRFHIEKRDLILDVNGVSDDGGMQQQLMNEASTTKMRVRKASRMFVADLARSEGSMLNVAVNVLPWGLIIQELHEGLLTDWNNKSEDKFEVGDAIVEVNGSSANLQSALRTAVPCRVVVRKAAMD